jgi:glycine cleavage system H protein
MSHSYSTDLKYTVDHEWAKSQNGNLIVGITQFAVEQLGDITLVSLDVKAGDMLTAGKAFGTIESVKTLSDLFAPVAGVVARVNAALVDKPELVNEDCYGAAWMIEITPAAGADLSKLLDAAAYVKLTDASAH